MRINSQAIEKLGQQCLDTGAEANFSSGRVDSSCQRTAHTSIKRKI